MEAVWLFMREESSGFSRLSGRINHELLDGALHIRGSAEAIARYDILICTGNLVEVHIRRQNVSGLVATVPCLAVLRVLNDLQHFSRKRINLNGEAGRSRRNGILGGRLIGIEEEPGGLPMRMGFGMFMTVPKFSEKESSTCMVKVRCEMLPRRSWAVRVTG